MYVDEGRLESFMMEVPIIQKPVPWFAEQTNGLVYVRQEPLSWKKDIKFDLKCIQISKEDAFN